MISSSATKTGLGTDNESLLDRRNRQVLAVFARLLVEENVGEGGTKIQYLKYEAALERVAERLGMTVGEMSDYLWSKKASSVKK